MAPERDNLVVVRLPSRRDFKESTVLDRCMCVTSDLVGSGETYISGHSAIIGNVGVLVFAS